MSMVALQPQTKENTEVGAIYYILACHNVQTDQRPDH